MSDTDDKMPLAHRSWWIGTILMLAGVLLGAVQTALVSFAGAHPQDMTAAAVLLAVGAGKSALASHSDAIVRKLGMVLVLALPFVSGCISGDVKAGAAAQHHDLPLFVAASQPAAGVDVAKWQAAAAALEREAADLDLAANGPSPATVTAK